MKAMIFAAGLGTRLKPLTDTMPKALVRIDGITLLERVVRRLAEAGFCDIVVNVHHFHTQITDYLKENGNFGLNIRVSDESGELLDTGGGILKAVPFLQGTEPFLVHNVDILSNVDLRALYDAHCRRDADVTLLVSQRETKRYLLFEKESGVMEGWTNVETGDVKSPYLDEGVAPEDLLARCEKKAFSGIHVISPRVFRFMAGYPHKFPIMDFYINECRKMLVQGCDMPGVKMIDVGKLYAIEQAERFVAELGM